MLEGIPMSTLRHGLALTGLLILTLLLPGQAPAQGDDPVIRGYTQANERMHQGMSFALSGDADQDFLRGMIPHHQGAIDMARVVLEHGKDPKIKKLAREIIKAQEKEIAQMKAWLAKKPAPKPRGQTAPPAGHGAQH
ncbi:MAG: DUF305 domain-containing protein [Desulfarculus sp.]|nr:DUF305 domain-containing protein [Desulfarculus sp.]